MGVALGLIAIALAGAAGEPKAGVENVPIQYSVCFLETEGMGWREAVFTRLTPVTRQGAATVWTAPGIVKPKLLQRAIKDRSALPVQTTAFKAWSGSPAHFSIRSDRHLVTQVAWDGNDRPAEAKPETVRTGPVGTMVGRKMDQGVLVQLVLEDTEVRAIHRLPLGGPTEPASSPETKKAAFHDEKCTQSPACCQAGESGDALSALRSVELRSFEVPGSIFHSLTYINDEPKLLTIPVLDGPAPSGTISEVRIVGNASIPSETIKRKLYSQAGQLIIAGTIELDIMTLKATGWFSDVKASYAPFPGEKNVLYLTVRETPAALAYRAAVTHNQGLRTAKPTSSSDCACAKDDVIKAHLEFHSSPALSYPSPTKAEPGTKGDEVSPVAIEVPEIASQEIAGEWLIPKDGILLVSFGPHTVADKEGKAVIRERLAIVEAAGVADGAVQRTGPAPGQFLIPMAPAVTVRSRAIPAPVGAGNLPVTQPALPSRSIPQGIHADGTPAELPPLPADDMEDAPSSESAEPRPSPQIKTPQPAPRPAPDSQMKRTGHSATSMLPTMPALFLAANPTVGFQFLMPMKAVSLKLPFNRRLEIEVFGRIIRNPEPASASAELVAKPKTSASIQR
jgi:hypothetical protein